MLQDVERCLIDRITVGEVLPEVMSLQVPLRRPIETIGQPVACTVAVIGVGALAGSIIV